jgi:hypothetical protein
VYWMVFAFLAFGFGLGMWEFLETARSKKRWGDKYSMNLPPEFSWVAFKLWKSAGQAGILVFPFVAWSLGEPWALGSGMAIVIVGSAIGFALRAVRSDRRT